jgi:hypothetical protein
MGFGGIPYFIKMDSSHVKRLMFHPLDWEWVLYNRSLEGCSYVKGCKTAVVVEQYARAVCSRNGWDAGLITPYASVRGLGESPFHDVGCGISLT